MSIAMSNMDFKDKVKNLLENHNNILDNPKRADLIQAAIDDREAIETASGALATWTPKDSTGRSPKDTVIVKNGVSETKIDWTSPNNIPLRPDVFDALLEDALKILSKKDKLYIMNKVVGAESNYALPTKLITDKALSALFVDNLFRNVPDDIEKSVFHNKSFTLIALPYDKIDNVKYAGELRKKANGKTSDMVIALNCDRKIGLVYGSGYCGSMKKLLFTAMNYLLPDEGILPLHCSANVDDKGNSALFLGLSGTGKTTLSTDAKRKMIGDDEHGWCNDGIANFEGGCYAKLIDLNPKKEPEIHKAVFTKRPVLENGVIIENAMMYPNGKFDLYDDRLAQNSRAGYPLSFLTNIKDDSKAGHPKTILFLTADANGVLPPISKLTKPQAMLWFMMGYTSKLAGTEVGITEPVSSFSRFFGQPFMPRNPEDYAKLLGDNMDKHKANVFLLNTGWSGGPYGIGKRMDIVLTRRLVDAALNGELDNVEYEEDELFHVLVPKSCDGVDDEILQPKNTWKDKREFDKRAEKLANDFLNHFYNAYGKANIDEEVKKQCPGK